MTPQQKIQAAKAVAANNRYHMSDEVRKRLLEMIDIAETAMGYARHDEGCSAGIDSKYPCRCGLDRFMKGGE